MKGLDMVIVNIMFSQGVQMQTRTETIEKAKELLIFIEKEDYELIDIGGHVYIQPGAEQRPLFINKALICFILLSEEKTIATPKPKLFMPKQSEN